MAVRGWNAAGLLLPLWQRYDGGRDRLASAVGTTGTTLSSINTGSRNLGYDLARRLATELGVNVFELGAPADAAATRKELRVIDRLREVEAALEALGPNLREIGGLVDRVSALERRGQPKTRRGGGQ